MYENVPKYVIGLSKDLRKNSTACENIMWNYLRNRGIMNLKFRRQHPIGRYIIDYYCNEIKLAIEIDGEIHEKLCIQEYDKLRQKELQESGIRVIRFTNEEILKNAETVISKLKKFISISLEERD